MGRKIVKFEADWCMPCKVLTNLLNDKDFKGIEIKVIDIEEDVNFELVQEYQVRSIPTLFYYQDDKLIGKTIGLQTKEEILKIFEKNNTVE